MVDVGKNEVLFNDPVCSCVLSDTGLKLTLREWANAST